LRPDLLFAHRVWYLTKVNLPEDRKGSSFYLVFPANNLNTTLVVNGQFVGFDKNPPARLHFDTEEVPVNATKKRSVLASMLRNLGSPFGGGKTVIAGANLDYSPVPIDKHANQFRTERGWFGDAAFTRRSADRRTNPRRREV